jgi:hypothetical protein
VPPEPPLDSIPWVIGEGKKDEMDESGEVLLRALRWTDSTVFLLPISAIGLISSDKPILLQEAQESQNMKERKKLEKTKVYC